MASDVTGTALTLAVVIAVAVAGAWAWSAAEQPTPAEAEETPNLRTRVILLEEETRIETPAVAIPANGIVIFPVIDVPLTNITHVTVTLHIEVAGPAAQDRILVRVENPSGATRDAESTGPVNLAGYQHSRAVISEWRHATKPPETVYGTEDTHKAEAWAAANHTDVSARGAWWASVEVTPGAVVGAREGSVSLGFMFRHYVGMAVLETAPAHASPAIETTQDGTFRVARDEDAPRTFITWAGLGRAVDRGPGPHGPL